MATPSAVLNHKLIKKVKDEKFDVDDLHHYSLLIQLGSRDLQVGVVDSRDHRYLLLEDYIFGEIFSNGEQLEVLKQLFESHALLQAGFWKDVRFSIKNNKFIQVPSPLFLEEASPDYLRFNANINGAKEEVMHCRQDSAEIVTVYAIYKELTSWIISLYPNSNVRFYHQSASFIEGVLNSSKSDTGHPLYIYVDRFKLHIAYANEGSLVYYNQFVIRHFSDYVKFIMLVLKSLHLDQRSSKVTLWGYIGKNSPHAVEFSKYISNVTFGGRPYSLHFGYLFDEVQEHHFYDLYNIYFLPLA